MSGRRQERIILVGTNGTGKTTLEEKLMSAYPPAGKRVLCVLPDDLEPAFYKYSELQKSHLPQIATLSSKINKIFFYKGLFDDVLRHFQNGLLVLDDARNFSGSRDEDLLQLFRRSRQNNIDIIFACHGLSEIPPSLLTYTTKLVLFQTTDSWQRLKANIPSPEIFDAMVKDVNKRANNHKNNCPAVFWKHGEMKLNLNLKPIPTGDTCECGAAYTKRVINPKIDLG